MKVPTHDAAPGAKSYGGMGERVLRAMGWSKCARPTTEATDATDDEREGGAGGGGGDAARGGGGGGEHVRTVGK